MSAALAMPPTKDLVAGKYELLRFLGRGAMGSVWEGRHQSLGTRVAIKLIDDQHLGDLDIQRRFMNEARAAASLSSKHAIAVHDFGVTSEGKPFIVMELLVGETLDERLAKVGRLPLRDVSRIIRQVCRALQQAHDHGIIHRDLKPQNIFITKATDDERETVKVVDFGLAKIQVDDAMRASGTRTGTILGTPYYMSPEQGRGLKTVDHRTDLWSLGVIAFECVTGRVPFEADSLTDLLVQASTSPLPRPSTIDSKIHTSFDVWLARALDRDPNRRFGSATELAEALERVSANAALVESVGEATTQPRPVFRRPALKTRRWPTAFGSALALALVGVVGALGVHHRQGPAAVMATQRLVEAATATAPAAKLEDTAPLPTLTPLPTATHSNHAPRPPPKPAVSRDLGAGF